MTLYRVEAPWFCAAYIVGRTGSVTRCAPILRRHVFGLSEIAAWGYCRSRNWKVSIVTRGD